MMYPRLYLARNLLKEDGLIFVSIDDHEADNLRKILSEVFGEENFVGNVVWENAYTAKYYCGSFQTLMPTSSMHEMLK